MRAVSKESLLFAANTIQSLSGPMYVSRADTSEALADERRTLEMVSKAAAAADRDDPGVSLELCGLLCQHRRIAAEL